MHPDQQKLNTAGYVTKTFTEYHFEVKKPGGKDVVNVWPTARKVLKKFSPGPAPYYTDIVEAVSRLLEKPSRKTFEEMKQELRDRYPVPGREDEVLEWWKQDPVRQLDEYAEIV